MSDAGAQITLSSKGYILWDFVPGVEVELDHALAGLKQVQRLNYRARLPIVVLMKAGSISMAARKLFQQESSKYTSKAAMVAKSPLQRVLASIFLGINKPPFPIKMVGTLEEAEQWLGV